MKRAFVCLVGAFAIATSARAEPVELEDAVVEHILEIRARDPELREDAFSKMGGSSVASKAFLHCFASDFVDLGERPELVETIEHFETGRRNSFNRQSEAAGVSWNLRYVLGGRPANFRRELKATNARWALVLFGGNDAQNENERVYLKRLVYLIEQMEEMGVVPILGSALPRRNAYKNRWIYRFNLITEAVAKHWHLPYIDYHAALSALPRKGLARDGVHPNVLPPGGLKNTCNLTEKGLRYGNNVRNLVTLEMLDALRRTTPTDPTLRSPVADAEHRFYGDADADPTLQSPVADAEHRFYGGAGAGADAGAGTDTGAGAGADADTGAGAGADADADADADAGADTGTGTDADAGTDAVPDPFPISVLVEKPDLPEATRLPRNCGSPKTGSRHYATRLMLAERTRLRASALDLDGHKSRVLLVRHDAESGESRCVRRRTQTLEVDARPGMWDLIVEVPKKAAEGGQMLILIARDPR